MYLSNYQLQGKKKGFPDMKSFLKKSTYAPFLGSSWKMCSIDIRE